MRQKLIQTKLDTSCEVEVHKLLSAGAISENYNFRISLIDNGEKTCVAENNEAGLMSIIKTIVNGKRVLYSDSFQDEHDAVVAHNDVLEFLKKVPENLATLVVTSPPYNIGKPYEKRVELERYLDWQKEVIKECVRILRPEGSICWEIGNYIENGEVYPLDMFFYDIFKSLGLKLRNRIIWRFGHGLHAQHRFSGRYETILWFTKSDNHVFNLDAVRVPQKYPGKRAFKGPNKGKPSGHPLGKNPSDVWDIVVQDWKNGVWDIPNVKSNHPEKTIHPAQFPIELIERLVLALTNENDTVFDPFMGVGSSLIAALLHNRKAIGVDKEKVYTDIAYQRITEALKGTLKRRLLGKPIYQPTGIEKVSKIPSEWMVSAAK
jgi:adenine-specific DNA-methyltransferase